jgi:hypothetical protein
VRSASLWGLVVLLMSGSASLASPTSAAPVLAAVAKKKRTRAPPPPSVLEPEPPLPEPMAAPEPPPAQPQPADVTSSELREAEPTPPPSRSHEPRPSAGFVIRLEPGVMIWSFDAARLEAQTGANAGTVRPQFIAETPSAFALLLHLGYNFFGHATVGVDVTGTGWDIFDINRGGGGFVAGTLAWHPLALLDALDVLAAPFWRNLDASLSFGLGYGIVGEKFALDGFHTELGFRAEYFLTEGISLGLALRLYPLGFGRYSQNLSGNVFTPLPNGSGGAGFLPALTVGFHPG